jgi:uncharacterized lipoprotein YddW (UPF0748 family)
LMSVGVAQFMPSSSHMVEQVKPETLFSVAEFGGEW